MGHASTEVALHSSHDDQEAQALLLGAFCSGRIRLAIGTHSPKHRSNRVDHTMGSGNQLL
jgi:hypothetical protein